MEKFEEYFQKADVDRDGRISGAEAVAFLQGSNLPRQVLAQVNLITMSSSFSLIWVVCEFTLADMVWDPLVEFELLVFYYWAIWMCGSLDLFRFRF